MFYDTGGIHLDHSTYCDHVVSDLILPVVEAAVKLPSPEQKNFVYLMTTVFFSEYRKAITSNKKTYKYVTTVEPLNDVNQKSVFNWDTNAIRVPF